jgi:uroporphyrin-III C-methyltransferase/precorrin-2 dehydrogenase/sirohydrochlorin ferrochelatase
MPESPPMLSAQRPGMTPLARLPVFLALAGERAVIAGGNAAAAWKAELLAASGAEVHVFAAEFSEELLAIATEPPAGRVILRSRDWQTSDLAGARIAVGAFEDEVEAARFAEAARGLKIPYNVIDKPAFCSFAFGAIVNRSPLVIGISTDGAAPVFAQTIRSRIEALLPRGFAGWAEAARVWRAKINRPELSSGERRRFWQLFSARAINQPHRPPERSDFDQLLSQARSDHATREPGAVTLVGVGNGDPELLTLRAARALRSADVIFFDEQVSADILDFSRREARKMLIRPSDDDATAATGALVIGLARSGKHVVRLIAGDPASGTEAADEIATYRAAGVHLELVPGIAATAQRPDVMNPSSRASEQRTRSSGSPR